METNTIKIDGKVRRRSVRRPSVRRRSVRRPSVKRRSVRRRRRSRNMETNTIKTAGKIRRRSVRRRRHSRKYHNDGTPLRVPDTTIDSVALFSGVVRDMYIRQLPRAHGVREPPNVVRTEFYRVRDTQDSFTIMSDLRILFHDGELNKFYIIQRVGPGFHYYDIDLDIDIDTGLVGGIVNII